MNDLQTLSFQNNRVRIIDRDGLPWFVAGDVCKILDLDTSVAVNGQWRKDRSGETYRSGGLDDDEKGTCTVSTLGGTQDVLIVSEPGLWGLILKSRKEEAHAFKRWVTHEVLPAIRHTGHYGTPRELSRLDLIDMAREAELARIQAESEKAALSQQIAQQAPKVALYDVAMAADNAAAVAVVAKSLGIGPNKLFRWLRDEHILIAHGSRYNLPFQEHIDAGRFTVRQYSITHFAHGIENKAQTLVTAKGMAYIHARWLAAHQTGLEVAK